MLNIQNFPVLADLGAVYLSSAKSSPDIDSTTLHNLRLLGLDYVLQGTKWETQTFIPLYRVLERIRCTHIAHIFELFAQSHRLMLIQSNASLFPPGSFPLNGFKSDIDFAAKKSDEDHIRERFREAGYSRLGFYMEERRLVEIPEDLVVDSTDDKRFIASLYSPLNLGELDQFSAERIGEVVDSHLPLVALAGDEIGCLTSIDITYSYYGSEIAWQGERVGNWYIQKKEQNLALAILRLKMFMDIGVLKPNLIFFLLFSLHADFDEEELCRHLVAFGILPFAHSLLDFYRPFLGQNGLNVLRSHKQRYFQNSLFDIAELHKELEGLINAAS